MSESTSKIKMVFAPKVYLVASQIMNPDELERFEYDEDIHFQQTTNITAHNLPELAGRACYWSFNSPRPGGNKEYLRHILQVGHGSVLEHSVFSFIVTNVSRSLTHELVRHRVGVSPSQLSQRFVDESSCKFVIPPLIAKDERLSQVFTEAMEHAQAAYKEISDALMEQLQSEPDKTLRRKQAREVARSVLPNATETKIYLTMNARAIRHFIQLRGSEHADQEIRQLAVEIGQVMLDEAPHLVPDLTFWKLANGTRCARLLHEC